MKTKLILASLALAALGFTACNGDDEPIRKSFIDIVTLDTNTSSGATMSFNRLDDSPQIFLTSSVQLPEKYFKAGTRILIIYQTPTDEQYVSGPCDIIQAGNTLGAGEAPIPAVVDTLDNWKSSNMEIVQKWRSGSYLNFSASMYTYGAPAKFRTYVDEKTLDNEYPELHVTYEPTTNGQQQNLTYYASYNIANIINRPNAKGVRVRYISAAGEKEFTIERGGSSITPAE